jgi:hypothetical protein
MNAARVWLSETRSWDDVQLDSTGGPNWIYNEIEPECALSVPQELYITKEGEVILRLARPHFWFLPGRQCVFVTGFLPDGDILDERAGPELAWSRVTLTIFPEGSSG